MTPNDDVARRLNAVWGVYAMSVGQEMPVLNVEGVVDQAIDLAVSEGYAKKGDRLVLLVGLPFGTSGATNTLRVVTV